MEKDIEKRIELLEAKISDDKELIEKTYRYLKNIIENDTTIEEKTQDIEKVARLSQELIDFKNEISSYKLYLYDLQGILKNKEVK